MEGNVCRKMMCSKCCRETEMELTSRDIERLEAAGCRDFHFMSDGARRLSTKGGKCVFLEDNGDCRVYRARPEGCRLYPLIMKLPEREPLLDDQCPHHYMFKVCSEDRILLEDLVDRLLREEP